MSRSQSTPDIYRVTVARTNSKSLDEELLDLCNMSGVTLDADVFKILLDLIKLNVSPTSLVSVLKKMASTKGYRGEGLSASMTKLSSSSDTLQSSSSTSSILTTNGAQSGRERAPISSRLRELRSHALQQ